MQPEQVVALIKTGIPDAEVLIDGEGCNFSVQVISPQFAGLSLVKKQQAVLATVKEQIKSGELHAMSVKAYTPDEWASVQQSN